MDTRQYSRDLGHRLREARTKAGLSQADVEEKTGGQLVGCVIGSYERGERNIPFEKFITLALLYGESPAALAPEIPGLQRPLIVCSQCGTPHPAGFVPAVLAR